MTLKPNTNNALQGRPTEHQLLTFSRVDEKAPEKAPV
jgi:hypothetical protein